MVRLANQCRPQKSRHHVYRGRFRHARQSDYRRRADALPTVHRRERPGGLDARPLRAVVQYPRQHHDFLYGDALYYRHDQLHHAAADRRSRRELPAAECHQLVADRCRCRTGDDLSRGRQVLNRGLDGLSALYWHRVQPGRGRGLLDLVYQFDVYRQYADRR